MTNTNESPMQKFMRKKAREEHRQMVEDYAKKGFHKGYNLRSYMETMDIIGGPKNAEEYTEICEDFINGTDAYIFAHENIVFVDPVKYGINNEQYIRIFKTPLSREGELFALVKPIEHKLTKQTYFELAKIAVCAEHYLAHSGFGTRGPVYARQMALIDPKFLESGKYKEVSILAARTNYCALKWIKYDKLSTEDFIDVFMVTATHWQTSPCWEPYQNPTFLYLLDSEIPSYLIRRCYQAYAEKYGIDELRHQYSVHTLSTQDELDFDSMLNDIGKRLASIGNRQSLSRKFYFMRSRGSESFEIHCDCKTVLGNCPVWKQTPDLRKINIEEWKHWDQHGDVQDRVDVTLLVNSTYMGALKNKLNGICKNCKLGHYNR